MSVTYDEWEAARAMLRNEVAWTDDRVDATVRRMLGPCPDQPFPEFSDYGVTIDSGDSRVLFWACGMFEGEPTALSAGELREVAAACQAAADWLDNQDQD